MQNVEETLAANRANTYDKWAAGDVSAKKRIKDRIVVPHGQQSFTAQASDTFFAIGSCFARNVEERLELAGATVTSRKIEIDDLGDNSARLGGIFNKYTPLSILQELQWAAGAKRYPPGALMAASMTDFYDPYLSGKAGRGSRDALMARRAQIGQYFAQAFQADVVVLTLGLIETWVDLKTGLALNEAPLPRLLKNHPDRFAFRSLSVGDCTKALKGIHTLLTRHGKAGQKIVLTVSPVPLGRTFTSDDVIIANTTSKSTLRVAAKHFADRTEGLDYFPSYEAVLHSDPALCWQADRLHVSDFIVGHIIRTFLTRYGVIADDAQTGDDIPQGAEADAALAALKDDPLFAIHMGNADSPTDLLLRLNNDLNKYKNMVIKLQSQQRRAKSGA